MFTDRREAGKRLSALLYKYKDKDCVVLAIPRGGVIVADEVCAALNAKMGLIITRKIGAPDDEELAIGAIAPDGTTVLDGELIRNLFVREDYIQKEKKKQLKEIYRRIKRYHADKLPYTIKKRTVIVVDDGMASGFTIIAAIHYLKKKGAKRIVIGTPVAPIEIVKKISVEADEIAVLDTPNPFYAIGHFYKNFEQVPDEEVLSVLKKYIN